MIATSVDHHLRSSSYWYDRSILQFIAASSFFKCFVPSKKHWTRHYGLTVENVVGMDWLWKFTDRRGIKMLECMLLWCPFIPDVCLRLISVALWLVRSLDSFWKNFQRGCCQTPQTEIRLCRKGPQKKPTKKLMHKSGWPIEKTYWFFMNTISKMIPCFITYQRVHSLLDWIRTSLH